MKKQGMGQTESAVLRFDNTDKHFYLELLGPSPHSHLCPDDERDLWQIVDSSVLRSSSLKAAARFRPYADDTCERVFNRAFNRELAVPPMSSLSFLDAHQIDGVRWVLGRTRSYLAHAPGAGKTAQAIVAGMLIREPGQVVVIVPPDLTYNWEREIERFTKHFRAFVTVGRVGTSLTKKAVHWKADFLIVPDSMLAKEWVYTALKKIRIKLLAVDEASRFKDPLASRTKALFGGASKYRTYGGLFQSAGRTVLLDGSPMPNRPMELWAPVYALDPEAIDCMGMRDYGFKFCGAKMNERGQWEFKHSSNERELRDRLRKRFMHVVTEDQLDHPERRRSMLFMNQDTRKPEMREWERKNLKLLKGEISEDLSQGEIAHHRKELGVSKIAWVVKYILNRLEDKNERILLFAWHREVCLGLARGLSKGRGGSDAVALVMGGTPQEAREKAFHSFQSGARGSVRVIVGNIAAMGRGHNLQAADRVVFCEPSWSDELNKQCEKRTSRRGRDAAAFVRCEYVVVPGSLDERVMTALFAKAQRVKRVIG
ncbi:MAG: DEAD/DEAH box helicase [Nitrospirota bacterium]|nr:DEAD/DEAH box helicase [Nitrospirota bacterium]